MDTLPDFLEQRSCAVCGATAYTEVYSWPAGYYPHDEFETASWDGRQLTPLALVRCSACAHVYARPSFTEAALGLVYPEDLVPDPITPEHLDIPKAMAFVEALRGRIDAGATVVDLGARYGAAVKVLTDAGYDALGIEYNSRSVEAAHQLGIPGMRQGTVETLDAVLAEAGRDHIDAVVTDDVLEHLIDPARDLAAIARLQRPGGLMVHRMMDWDCLARRLFGKRWHYIQPAAHPNYYREASVRRLLDAAGYDIVEVSRDPLWLQLRRLVRLGVDRVRGRRAPWLAGGKRLYLDVRPHLRDMFLVVAVKR